MKLTQTQKDVLYLLSVPLILIALFISEYLSNNNLNF
jgi:hypothetical protein